MRMLNTILPFLAMMRPQQWTKNLLVFAALLFAAQAHIPSQRIRSLRVFLAFCLLSSAVYIFNDVVDRKADQAHPRKRRRPIASGQVKIAAAVAAAALLLAAGALLSWQISAGGQACLLGYLVLQAAYTLVLKHEVILDVMAISAGFVLRAVAGAFAIHVVISQWLLICTILLSLFLALSKRRSEILAAPDASAHRSVLGEYSLPFIDQLIAVVTAGTLLSYILYTYSDQTMQKFPSHLMPLTLPFVLYGIFRYLYLIYQKSEGGEPELLMVKDLPLLLDIILWAAAVALIVAAG
jgi:4-hydroxybenzoate polyprenyltransferase